MTDLLPEPGFTAFALHLFDQNGPVAQLCQTISARQTAYYDIGALGILAPGFRGSAVVSAVASDHWLPDQAGVPQNFVSLGAVAVQRPAAASAPELPATCPSRFPASAPWQRSSSSPAPCPHRRRAVGPPTLRTHPGGSRARRMPLSPGPRRSRWPPLADWPGSCYAVALEWSWPAGSRRPATT